jgi:hypothetical protein
MPQEQAGAIKMYQTGKDEMLLRRYLLGDATDQERERVEEQLMTDRQYFSHFLEAEEILIDEYVNGALGPGESETFETYFLRAPERRDKLAFSRSLNRYIRITGSGKSIDAPTAGMKHGGSPATIAWPGQTLRLRQRALLAAAMLILIAGTVVLLAENARIRKRIHEQQATPTKAEEELRHLLEEQIARNDELMRQLQESQSEASRIKQELARLEQANGRHQQSPTSRIASLILAPGSVRDSGEINRVALSTGIQLLNLELILVGEGDQSYRIKVQTVEGRDIWRQGNLRLRQRSGEKIVMAAVPANQLPEGDYLITLSAAKGGRVYKEVATYYLTILRE